MGISLKREDRFLPANGCENYSKGWAFIRAIRCNPAVWKRIWCDIMARMIRGAWVLVAVLVVGLLFAGCEAPGDGAANSRTAGSSPSVGQPSYEAARVSGEGEEASEAAIGVVDGRVLVAYVVKSGEAGDLYVRSFDPAKRTYSEPVRVNPVPGQLKTWYGDPPTIAAGPEGTVYVGWTAKYPEGARGTILYMSASRDGGASFDEPVRVNDDAEPASHGMHSMAVAPDGKIYFAWLDERYLKGKPAATPTPHSGHSNSNASSGPHPEEAEVESNAELYFARSTDGKTFSQNRRLAGDVCPCCKTSTVISDKGRVAIGFRKVFDGEFRHIAVTSSDDFGGAWSQPLQVSDDGWRINACPVSGPALRWDGDELAVAWYSGGEAGPRGVYESRSTDGLRSFTPRRLVEETSGGGFPGWAGQRLFWSTEGNVRGVDPGGVVSSFGAGKSVVAAAADGKAFRAFVVAEGDRKAVWLSWDK